MCTRSRCICHASTSLDTVDTDVVYIATEHDSVYAFDAAGQPRQPLWQVSLLGSGTPVPARDVRCPFIAPEVGITSTPVIDSASATIYVLARTKEGYFWAPGYVHRPSLADVCTSGRKARSTCTVAWRRPRDCHGAL